MQDRDYAIVVGIKRYPLLKKDLEGSVADAEAFKNWLIAGGSVSEGNIKTILSEKDPQPGDRPILAEIDTAFAELFARAKANPARRLYGYFAGHGCSAAAGHLALLMANAEREYLDRAMNAQEYHGRLAKQPLFKEQILFYDCCRNYDERVMGRGPEWTGGKPPAGAEDIRQFVMFGAAFTQYANEKAIEYSDRRGLFTKALLEGLNGEAATRVDGSWVVTTTSLIPYVTKRLAELAKEFQLKQRPSLAAADDIVIAPVDPKPQAVTVQVAGAADGTVVIVKNDKLKEIKRGEVQGGVVSFDLVFATYMFQVDGNDARSGLFPFDPGGPSTFEI